MLPKSLDYRGKNMFEIVILFLSVSLLLYVLFGGADFGAGIAEAFVGKKYASLIFKAIGPVWAANHLWLILVVVIVFIGFPEVYAILSKELHIILILVFVGIVIRGLALVLRHFIPEKKEWQRIITLLFQMSSIFTTFLLGVTAGALIEGQIAPSADNYFDRFVFSWLSPFTLAMGVFTCTLFAFIACAFLIGDTDKSYARHSFIHLSRKAMVVMVISGMLVFIASSFSDVNLFVKFNFSPVSILCIIAATILLPILWRSFNYRSIWTIRFLTFLQVTFIFFGWFATQFPVAIYLKREPALSFYGTAASPSTMSALAWTLIIGSIVMLPLLARLVWVFKFSGSNK